MNNIPTMMLTTGFKVDQNGALTEIDVPNVVSTLDAPKKFSFLGQTINFLPFNSTLQELSCPNCQQLPANICKGFTALASVNLASVTSFTSSAGSGVTTGRFYGCSSLTSLSLPSIINIANIVSSGNSSTTTVSSEFYNCTGLTSINLPLLTTLTSECTPNYGTAGAFIGCTGLTSINLPSLSTLSCKGSQYNGVHGAFANCTGLRTVTLPSLSNNTESGSATYCGSFHNCTNLESVQLGSDGHPVAALGSNLFSGCTQAGLTITIYTNGGASLSGEPWGATNATIVYEEA